MLRHNEVTHETIREQPLTRDSEREDGSDAGLRDVLVHRGFMCAVKQVPHIDTAIQLADVEDGWSTG